MVRAFVVGKGIDMRFEDLNPTSKIKTMLRKKAIENVHEHIAYQQKKVSDNSIIELRILILSEEKRRIIYVEKRRKAKLLGEKNVK